ncbi:Protein of unknown function [Gryllus bimaculatus]|nr:Protein of unknown function [Gryllus bimaculatus]
MLECMEKEIAWQEKRVVWEGASTAEGGREADGEEDGRDGGLGISEGQRGQCTYTRVWMASDVAPTCRCCGLRRENN